MFDKEEIKVFMLYVFMAIVSIVFMIAVFAVIIGVSAYEIIKAIKQ